MPYSVNDIVDLVQHHVVLSEDAAEDADANLALLIDRLTSLMSTRPEPAEWLFCDRCGCAVDTDVIPCDARSWTPDGDFLCSSCLYPDES